MSVFRAELNPQPHVVNVDVAVAVVVNLGVGVGVDDNAKNVDVGHCERR